MRECPLHSFEKETLTPGDTVNIIVKNVDKDGVETDYPPETNFEVAIVSGCGLGLINGTDSHVTSIRQPIKFVVADSISSTDSVVVLRVGTPEIGRSINGSITEKTPASGKLLSVSNSAVNMKAANITNKKLLAKIAADTSCTIYTPIYTNTSDAAAGIDKTKIKVTLTGLGTVWPYKTSGNPITSAKIKVTNGDQPQANEKVKITIKRIDKSGGHDHPNSSDLTLWGRISINGVKGNPVTAYTDQKGEITTEEVRSSEFGGEYIIEAYLESKPDIKDKVSFIVKVTGLSLLPENSSYTKIGGTDKHFGPPGYQTDNNHWGTNVLNQAIQNLSAGWYNKFLNVPKLQINDMSLPYGGWFDISGNWSGDHKTHRIGNSVDIQSRLMLGERFYDANRNGWYDQGIDYLDDQNNNGLFDGGQLTVFRNIALDLGGLKKVNFETKPITKNEHWHLIK